MFSNSKLRLDRINILRKKLLNQKVSVGTWQLIQSFEVSKILSLAKYEWVTIDLEHGSFDESFLSPAFDIILSQGSLPLARIARPDKFESRSVLDKGAAGVIIPMVETPEQLDDIINSSLWPDNGNRGVGYCNANDFGKNFKDYKEEAQRPIFVAMIENTQIIENLEKICSNKYLDALFIGPYDLSASLGITGDFKNKLFVDTQNRIFDICSKYKKPFGYHVINPDKKDLQNKISKGATFLAIAADTIFLQEFAESNKYFEIND